MNRTVRWMLAFLGWWLVAAGFGVEYGLGPGLIAAGSGTLCLLFLSAVVD